MKAAVPALITLGAVFAALLAMTWAGSHPYWACNAIIAAALCDMIDGRVARALDAQSEFGAQLDSLADVISFGVAPAVLLYRWTAPPDPALYWLLPPFAFVAGSAIRLARFNVAEQGDQFTGIPTPVAALTATTRRRGCPSRSKSKGTHGGEPWLGVAALLTTAILMVAPMPFPSFKRFRNRYLQIAYFGAMAVGLSLLIFGGPGGAVLLALLLFYIARGIVGAAFARATPA